MKRGSTRGWTIAMVLGGMTVGATAAAAQGPIYVRPGAPGEPTQRISAAEVTVPRSGPYTHHEVHFVQHMMVHHGQAVTMSALAVDRAQDQRVVNLARRIDIAQAGELHQMTQWLRIRGHEVPDHTDPTGHENMPGMVSPEDMARLEAASGAEFDRLFLELMIQHHHGALQMVEELEAMVPVLEANISVLALEIVDIQYAEIVFMERLLEDLDD
ncbi:DUF305 domain-containing protein [Egicoccus halophilus]|uniref:DUF305 domain-containing protein n=1 Tax=Egicoccus halophilus TaxID=1670830 RepID=A0A8J3ET59_9ACTN|nr:DUF305 domain-containing protein [Egicoccus halophilus]GGI03247.1 hypothetical protein GCM10011354_03120 [Egicoccus halophilus]